MRTIEDAPASVIGITTIRGKPTPVIDLGAALGERDGHMFSRLVTLRVGERSVALAVAEVPGIRTLEPSALEELPPLVRNMAPGYADRIGLLDSELLVVLRSSVMVPETVWASLLAENVVPSP